MKTCTRCKIEQNESNFCKASRNSDGLNYWCNTCRKKYRKDHNDDRNKYMREFCKKDPIHNMFRGAKNRARIKKIPFTIIKKDLFIPTHCPILGIPLQKNKNISSDNSPSLDRIIPELGYVPGNILVMSKRANTIKSNGTLDEHEKIVKFLKNIKNLKSLDINDLACYREKI
jgi:hypothetical protein